MSTFALQLKQFADKTERECDDLVGLVVVKIAQRLDERSPVGDGSYWKHKPPPGYVGGFFRGSWMLGVGEVPSGLGEIDPSGAATVGRIIATVPEHAAGPVYFLGNTAPYAVPIEEGHSRQAPNGLVALTAMEFQSVVKESVGEVAWR